MPVVTTLQFAGRTEEALLFYRDAMGAEILFLMRFRDRPDPSFIEPGLEDLIFHATFRIEGTELKASDVGADDPDACDRFSGFALLLEIESSERAHRVFEALAVGGEILIPLATAAFTSLYGIVIDRFGISWKISVA
jgi:PhnB protein